MNRIAGFLALVLFALGARAATVEKFDMEALRGKVVLVDFWASWCAPCKESFPWMQRMQGRYGPQGLAIIAVNLDQERRAADEFLHRTRPNFDVLFDPQAELAERFHVETMPSSYFLDRRGRKRFTHSGFQASEREAFEKEIKELLAEAAPNDDTLPAGAAAMTGTNLQSGEGK